MGIRCFMLEEAGKRKRFLRRYASGPCTAMPGEYGFHNGKTFLDVVDHVPRTYIKWDEPVDVAPFSDPRWPAKCACGYEFRPSDERQIFGQCLYRRIDNGEEMTLEEAPHGAMWDAWWDSWKGPDGLSLVVKCPPDGREWFIDGPASNCTNKQDIVHRCWTRQGIPPNIDVDKHYGPSCSAGAGSISMPKWHGFLSHGELRENRA